MIKKEVITIYTDGACRGNPGVGGWGVYINFGKEERRYQGSEPQTTNNRMELTAAIEALKIIHHYNQTNPSSDRSEVQIYTDSVYVQKGITDWLQNWIMRSWRTSSGSAVKNIDLWKELEKLAREFAIDWRWVKGHDGNHGNTEADRLANLAIDKFLNL